jgi:hypothetical protein
MSASIFESLDIPVNRRSECHYNLNQKDIGMCPKEVEELANLVRILKSQNKLVATMAPAILGLLDEILSIDLGHHIGMHGSPPLVTDLTLLLLKVGRAYDNMVTSSHWRDPEFENTYTELTALAQKYHGVLCRKC